MSAPSGGRLHRTIHLRGIVRLGALPLTAIVGCVALFSGCATPPKDPVERAAFEANHDPLEPMNRKIFAANLALDKAVIVPVAKGYRAALPQGARDSLRNIIDNLNEPVVFFNCLFQLRFKDAGTTVVRFVLNSTLGFGGTGDVASELKLKKQVGDFGQTLWFVGYGDGPYLVVPIFGPMNPRDGAGRIVDIYLDPFRYIARRQNYPSIVSASRVIVDGVDLRERNLDTLAELQHESIDYYASLRSLYRQNRAASLRGEQAAKALPAAGFYDDPGK